MDDVRRGEVLRSYGVCDPAPETGFDRLTELLAGICAAPIAIVQLTDGTRQWLKSVHGADGAADEPAIPFGAHAIEQAGVYLVEDAAADPRYASDPWVRGPAGIRFYAGAPLRDAAGMALGSLAVLDRVPRVLNALQLQALQTLAQQVMAQLEARRRQHELEQALAQRQLAETALHASEARWGRLFAASATGIASAGADGHFLSANPAFCQLTGRSLDELRKVHMLSFTQPGDAARCNGELQRLRAGEIDSFSIDKRYLRPDGSCVWVRAAVALMHGGDGHAEAAAGEPQYVAVVQDIDGERAAQRELQASHDLIALAGRMARVGGWAVELPQRTVRWSDELLAIVGMQRSDMPGIEEALGWYTPASLERITPALEACFATGTPFDLDLEWRPPGMALMSIHVIGRAVHDAAGRIVGAHGALHDQTPYRRALDVVRDSEERFRNVARATTDAIWDWNLADDSLWWSDGMRTLFGYQPHQMSTDAGTWLRRIHPDERRGVMEGVFATLRSGGDRWSAEFRFQRADGSYANVLDSAYVIRDAAGHARRMVGGISDLTAPRAAEQRLRQQAALLDAARDAILVTDLERRVTYWNQSAERIFGWTAEEAIGRSARELLGEGPLVSDTAHAEVMARGEWANTVRLVAKSGHEVVADVSWTLLRDAAGRPEAILAIMTDVTQRTALQAQLQQSQRLEAVGQLTGGVAHDFNNLLTVILGNADLLADLLAEQPQLLPLVDMTRTAAQRGAELTHRLLAFARKQPLQPMAVDTHQLLTGMDALLRRTLPENIELELVRAAGLWPALADPVQLESAVLNLVLNARDAMPGGGKITLETANAWVDLDYAERHADVLPGQYVLLSVSDTGSGMTAAQLARAFEPFYTTKGASVGTGLGLSMVYGFAKQSRGHVKLYSEPNQGTTARLYLPRADAAPAPPAAAPRLAGQGLRGSALVLVVEDDPLVRRHASDLLTGLGYRVVAAEHGAAALDVLRERDDIELLFTDVVMPGGMNGRQLAEAALRLRPGLKVLYTSGYTENAIVHHGRLDRGVHLLPKPYRSVDLARKVHAVLSGGSA